MAEWQIEPELYKAGNEIAHQAFEIIWADAAANSIEEKCKNYCKYCLPEYWFQKLNLNENININNITVAATGVNIIGHLGLFVHTHYFLKKLLDKSDSKGAIHHDLKEIINKIKEVIKKIVQNQVNFENFILNCNPSPDEILQRTKDYKDNAIRYENDLFRYSGDACEYLVNLIKKCEEQKNKHKYGVFSSLVFTVLGGLNWYKNGFSLLNTAAIGANITLMAVDVAYIMKIRGFQSRLEDLKQYFRKESGPADLERVISQLKELEEKLNQI